MNNKLGQQLFFQLVVLFITLPMMTGCFSEKQSIILSSISVTKAPVKYTYLISEKTLDLSGIIVTGTYSDGSTKLETVTSANISGFDTTTIGLKTLTVTVNNKTTTFNIMVDKPVIVTTENAIYVSTTGNDISGTGSITAPYLSLQKALDCNAVTTTGSVIILRGGVYKTYREIRVRKANVTIKSMDGEWAILETPTAPVDNNGNPATVDNCENPYVISFRMEWNGDSLEGDNASGCKLQRLELKGGAFYCIKFETTWDWDSSVPPSKRYGASNITIEDCKIHDSGRDCIKLTENCNNITIRKTEIYNSGMSYPAGTPIEDKNAEGIDNVQGNSLLVEDSYIHDIATNGIYFKGGAKDCIIQRSTVERCGDGGILLGFDTSPEYFDTVTNPNYYENINGTIRNCIVRDTNYEGIGMYASKDAKVYNNTLVNVGKNNAHSAIYFGVATQDYDPIAKRPANINPSVYNNIVKQASGLNNLMIAIRYSAELDGLSGLSGKANIDNNCYYIEGNNAEFSDGRPESTVDKINLSEWKTHIGGESSTLEKNPMIDINSHLTSQSPCINTGKNIISFSDDFDKQPRKETFDIGADEF